MKKSILFVMLFSFIFSAGAQKSDSQFSERWKKVDKLAKEQLSESALKEVESIFSEAQKAGNFNQTVKAFIYKMRFTLEKNPDEVPAMLKDFENFSKTYKNEEEKALLHSMTAELYALYYQSRDYTINRRTQIEGYIPENINEWSKNIFFDKVVSELKLSMQNSQLLQKTNASMFEALLEKGEDSAEIQPTLFDFLGQRAVNILQGLYNVAPIKNPLNNLAYFAKTEDFINLKAEEQYADSRENQIIEIYQQLLGFRLKENNIPALIYIDLQRLDFVRGASELFNAADLYKEALLQLKNKYAENEAVVEVFEKLSQHYLYSPYSEEENDLKKQAYDIANEGISKYPNYKRINGLKNIVAQVTQKNIQINYPEVGKPGNELKIKVSSANIKNLQLNIYRVNATAIEYYGFVRNNSDKAYPNRKLIANQDIVFTPNENFGTDHNEFTITVPEYGIYEFSVLEKGSKKRSEQAHGAFTSSDFAFIQRRTSAVSNETYVLDRMSGHAIENVHIDVYQYKWNGSKYDFKLRTKAETDNKGLIKVEEEIHSSNVYFLSKGNDRYFSHNPYTYYSGSNNNQQDKIKLSLFTDRSIYWPGQTVYFKGIAYQSQEQKVVENATFEVKLFDANRKEISKKTFKSNEFGSFKGEFVLPEGGLNGAYQIQVNNFSTIFHVEEYKRPTFEVNIEKPKTEIHFGQELRFQGEVKAYAGYSIVDAQVNYVIKRRSHRLFWWFFTPEETVASGTTVSNSAGKFNIDFTPERIKNKNSLLKDQFYTYTLETNVTDTKGETQRGVQSVSVGDKSLFIVSEVANMYDKQKALSVNVHTETLNGETISSTVNYSLYRLENSEIYKEKLSDLSTLKEETLALSGTFKTDEKALKLDASKLQSGYYKLVLTTPDAQGKEVKTESVFVLYSSNEKRPPVKMYSWLQQVKTDVLPGENAVVRFGSSANNVRVLYELMQGGTVLESKWIELNNEIKNFDIPFRKEYGDGLNVLFTFMKDEQIFSQRVEIKRIVETKKLTPALSVFRDKLKPGETAEWTATIPEAADKKMLAELMIGMYDASLDAIRPHSWAFNPAYNLSIPNLRTWSGFGVGSQSSIGFFDIKYEKTKEIYPDNLNWFGMNMSPNVYFDRAPLFTGGSARKSRNMMLVEVADDMAYSVVEEESLQLADVAAGDSALNEEEKIETKETQIRTNFNETAFFYPQLKTDKDGNVKFSFTVPESLTRWNVKMLAHTPDLYFGQSEAQVVTQKELMVQLNMPRFVRRSDKLKLVANVINLTENTLTANVQFELINPENEKAIALKDNKVKKLTLEANETKTVEWQITEFSAYELVVAKVVAQAGEFSDGEQHYLPVLPDKVLITESLPLIIRGNETRDFRFESLINQAKNVDSKSLTIEFASNPAWYAVQALPTLSAPENENAIDYFTAYYVNGLATYMANSNPKIAKVFDQWKREGGSREALLSNLEKNTELKNMLLEETPWVMAAKDETEQKRQIALLFDLNQQKNQGEQYLDKLMKLQKPSGGFAWFEGMNESRYITQEILLGMARYKRLAPPSPPEGGDVSSSKASNVNIADETNSNPSPLGRSRGAVRSALEYIDLQIAKDFDYLKKNNKNYKTTMVIGDMQWFYLHVRSEYKDVAINEYAKEAVDFYTSQAEKYWTKASLYGKAATALICHRNGKTEIANSILKSLKENALKTDEMGMYWARNTAGYFWNEQPISVQTAILEAFAEITQNQNDVDEMKIWLLKQKQTQRWNSPISTVDAVYSLLNYGTDWLANEGQVEIKLNNKVLEPQQKEAGTGYFKERVEGKNIQPKMGNVNVRKSDVGVGWGAMYWQYFQDIDKVQQSGKALSVTKSLFVEKTENNKTSMLPIEQTNLTKGDKIITRLVVTTDRDLEFVALKDLRASCLEPVEQRSRMVWREGVSYYETTKDASTQFFFNFLPKGTYVFEYATWANNSGEFASGIANIQCLYAPEFVSYSNGSKMVVE